MIFVSLQSDDSIHGGLIEREILDLMKSLLMPGQSIHEAVPSRSGTRLTNPASRRSLI
jgi:hypothetical protein